MDLEVFDSFKLANPEAQVSAESVQQEILEKVRSSQPKDVFTCSHCDLRFANNTDFKKHQRTHTEDILFGCGCCGKKLTEDDQKIHPLRRHSEGMCASCFRDSKAAKPKGRKNTFAFGCDYCGKIFTNKFKLTVHLLNHPEYRSHTCAHCGSIFSDDSILQKHQKTHVGEKPFKCCVCGKFFAHKWTLKTHEVVHIREKRAKRNVGNFACTFCDARFSGFLQARQHERTEHEKELKDANEFPDSSAISEKHGFTPNSVSLADEKPVVSSVPAQTLLSFDGEIKKVEVSSLPIDTKPLIATLPESSLLSIEPVSIISSVPAETLMSSQSFSLVGDNAELASSSLKSATANDFTVSESDYQPQIFIPNIQTQSGEIRISCRYCRQMFTEEGSLEEHERTHDGEKPFACGYCKRPFRKKWEVTQHLKTHTGEKPFNCSYCNKSFAHKRYVKDHERIHTGEKPYACGFCDFRCARNTHLRKHVRRNHKCQPKLPKTGQPPILPAVSAEHCVTPDSSLQNEETFFAVSPPDESDGDLKCNSGFLASVGTSKPTETSDNLDTKPFGAC